ncbi:unnamed protein product [Closterium sp. NIES-54]
MPVRLAKRLMDLQFLPHIVVINPHIKQVYDSYRQAFDMLTAFPEIKTLEDNVKFTQMLTMVRAAVGIIGEAYSGQHTPPTTTHYSTPMPLSPPLLLHTASSSSTHPPPPRHPPLPLPPRSNHHCSPTGQRSYESSPYESRPPPPLLHCCPLPPPHPQPQQHVLCPFPCMARLPSPSLFSSSWSTHLSSSSSCRCSRTAPSQWCTFRAHLPPPLPLAPSLVWVLTRFSFSFPFPFRWHGTFPFPFRARRHRRLLLLRRLSSPPLLLLLH